MLLKAVIFYVLLKAIFAVDSPDQAHSSGNVENEDDLTDQSEEPTPLPIDSISSIETNTHGDTVLTSVPTNSSSSGNQSNGELVTTSATTITNDTNQLNQLIHDNSSKPIGDLGHHEITFGKWVGLTNYGKSGSFLPIKGGPNYGGKMYYQDITRFPQRHYGIWKGTPYTGISDTGPFNYGRMFGNAYPMNYFRGILFHKLQFDSNSREMKGNMKGDMHSVDDSWGDFGGSDSEIPFKRGYSFGRWIPSGANKFKGEGFGDWKPMRYRHMFGNMYPMLTAIVPSSNNFEYGTNGNFKAYNYGGHDFGKTYGKHFPSLIWK